MLRARVRVGDSDLLSLRACLDPHALRTSSVTNQRVTLRAETRRDVLLPYAQVPDQSPLELSADERVTVDLFQKATPCVVNISNIRAPPLQYRTIASFTQRLSNLMSTWLSSAESQS